MEKVSRQRGGCFCFGCNPPTPPTEDSLASAPTRAPVDDGTGDGTALLPSPMTTPGGRKREEGKN